MVFLFTHLGRSIEPDQTPEDVGMEAGDEILAVEMMDLTRDEIVRIRSLIAYCLGKLTQTFT